MVSFAPRRLHSWRRSPRYPLGGPQNESGLLNKMGPELRTSAVRSVASRYIVCAIPTEQHLCSWFGLMSLCMQIAVQSCKHPSCEAKRRPLNMITRETWENPISPDNHESFSSQLYPKVARMCPHINKYSVSLLTNICNNLTSETLFKGIILQDWGISGGIIFK
jgi:hypothetical protein